MTMMTMALSYEQPRVSHRALVDACASWWTQGAGHGNPGMALAIAEAAGRYGHIIFAGNIHAPALEVRTGNKGQKGKLSLWHEAFRVLALPEPANVRTLGGGCGVGGIDGTW